MAASWRVQGNGVLDLLLGKRRYRQVGYLSFGGEARELLGEEGLQRGRAHRLDAVLEGLGAAGLHRGLDGPASGRTVVRSRYAGEELRGAGLG